MHAVIRRYTPTAAIDQASLDDLKRRLESEFIPTLQDVSGFHNYYVVQVGDRDVVSIGVFEDKAGADESTRRAADFLKGNPLRERLGTPEVLEGELLVSKESAIATR